MLNYLNIQHSHTVAKALFAFATIGVLCLQSCSSNSTIEDVEEIVEKNPMRFTAQGLDQEQTILSTRAGKPLSTGFLVSTWKGFNSDKQQTVMDNYVVTIDNSYSGSTPSRWDYTNVLGQIERYWDLSSYPYRFHAIAPAPDPSNKSSYKLGEIDSNTGKITLSIPSQYVSQTCSDGVLSEGKEPFTFAQVGRDSQGKDMDIIAGEEINLSTSPTPLIRTVAMPFHHLTSKVRFAVYTNDLWATSKILPITDVTINVTSSDFITEATKYEFTANTANGSLYSPLGFKEPTKVNQTANSTYSLLSYSGEGKTDNNLGDCSNQATAFFFDCKEGMLQIPQENIQMTATLTVMLGDSPYKKFIDVPITLVNYDDPDTPVIIDTFSWQPGYIYTYYLKILDLGRMEFEFTASLTPWVDVEGGIITNLEK